MISGVGEDVDPADDEADGIERPPEEEDVADEALLDTEPDYGGWFDGVDNYIETFDLVGEEEVGVAVGAGAGENFYEPAAIRVDTQATVVWEWTSEEHVHTVTEEHETFASEAVQKEDHQFTHTFGRADRYRYYCENHGQKGMRGAVVVEA